MTGINGFADAEDQIKDVDLKLVIYGPVIKVRPGYPDKRKLIRDQSVASVTAAMDIFIGVAPAGSEAYVTGLNNCIRAYWTKPVAA